MVDGCEEVGLGNVVVAGREAGQGPPLGGVGAGTSLRRAVLARLFSVLEKKIFFLIIY